TIDPSHTGEVLANGLPASPGAATGQVVFDADEAKALAEDGHDVILVRLETSPEDFHGMLAARAVLTARGGMTSHAAVVARGMGKPSVVGCTARQVDYDRQQITINGKVIPKGVYIPIDGSTGAVMLGKVPTIEPQVHGDLATLLGWADEIRKLGVRANAD